MQPHKSERKALMSLELEQVKVDAHKRSSDQILPIRFVYTRSFRVPIIMEPENWFPGP